jgi:hypothetical protein
VVVVASIGRKVNFAQKLLLMMLEFSDHFASILVLEMRIEVWRGSGNIFWGMARTGRTFLRR